MKMVSETNFDHSKVVLFTPINEKIAFSQSPVMGKCCSFGFFKYPVACNQKS